MSRRALHTLPAPGLLWGDRPERRVRVLTWGERGNAWLQGVAERVAARTGCGRAGFVARVRAAQFECIEACGDAAMHDASGLDLQAGVASARAALARHGFTPDTVVHGLALASVAARRALGVQPFDTQLLAARAVLDHRLAEMATGEGKTLTVALAAATAALAGMPVHVVTANDYLVARDAEHMTPLYAALGLRVGTVVQADSPAQRALAYACHITYVTAKELVFDYLRDGLLPPASDRDAAAQPATPHLLRGLCMAIVDEADSILIDEARVPLILSQAQQDAQVQADSQAHAEHALRLARGLQHGRDFALDRAALVAALTDAGRTRLEVLVPDAVGMASGPSAVWRNRLHREHAVCTGLAALHLFQRDRHYLVQDAQVAIVDDTTGRVAAGRAWSNGLQQLIELKENLPLTLPLVTLAQLTYQRFFPRYHHLGGLSGTLRDSRGELLHTYRMAVRRVPLRRQCQRRVHPSRLHADHSGLWRAVVKRIEHLTPQPVLVACDSVAEAAALSRRLSARGLLHTCLHADQPGDEAAVVARAGQRGAITVATNMAGRGTDIVLGEGVAALGGLHVICCQLNAARRIDRQLAGRSARQGDPGAVETWLSLDTALLARAYRGATGRLLKDLAPRLPSWAVRGVMRWPQWCEEQRQQLHRKRLAAHDAQVQRQFGFAGPAE